MGLLVIEAGNLKIQILPYIAESLQHWIDFFNFVDECFGSIKSILLNFSLEAET